MLFRSLSLAQLPRVAPTIRAAEQAARLRVVAKCVLVLLLPDPQAGDIERCRSALSAVVREWGEFSVSNAGKYLGVWRGPGALQQTWAEPLRKFKERVVAQVARGPLASALPLRYASHVVSLFS